MPTRYVVNQFGNIIDKFAFLFNTEMAQAREILPMGGKAVHPT